MGIMTKIKSLLFLLLFSLHITGQAGTAEPDADSVIKQLAAQVISYMQQQQASSKQDTAQFYNELDDLLKPYFDFSIISKLILGKHWASADDLQRERFVEQLKLLLLQTYAHALFEYADKEIIYLPAGKSPRPNVAVVKTEVRSDQAQPLPIQYRMHKKDQWKVIDVSIDGISMVLTYRGAFADTLKKDGVDVLIAQLTEKNTKGMKKAAAK